MSTAQQPQERIGVVGLGYVGLPLAVAFGQLGPVVGFDINERRLRDLRRGLDATNETDAEKFRKAQIHYTSNPDDLKQCTFIIVAVPTPVDQARQPDLEPLRSSSTTVGKILQPDMVVVYESTVYPGVTEDYCLPILEQESGLKLGQFGLGYSPERINPGDHKHTLSTVIKIVSGHDAPTLARVAAVYRQVVKAGVHEAPNLKTAEAAKVIENIQRDLNIALMNELSRIFARVGINTDEVLAAAGTKWNFHQYHPGLVGGHCIGVDPYYMTYLAMHLDMHPRVILAGRETNDGMGRYVGSLVAHELSRLGKPLRNAKVVLFGLTFKEDVPDYRNSRAEDVIAYLKEFGCEVLGCEPMLSDELVRQEFKVEPVKMDQLPAAFDAALVINRHQRFKDSLTLDELSKHMSPPLLVDIKNLFDRNAAKAKGFNYLSL
ncbi:MAG: nucleotide sugar dehydrogenase [bacterium]